MKVRMEVVVLVNAEKRTRRAHLSVALPTSQREAQPGPRPLACGNLGPEQEPQGLQMVDVDTWDGCKVCLASLRSDYGLAPYPGTEAPAWGRPDRAPADAAEEAA